MDDKEFDQALIGAAFSLAAERGWSRVSVPAAAMRAGLKLDEARGRFPNRLAVLMKFGRLADMAALAEGATPEDPLAENPKRDLLFGMIMRRIDMMQAHRSGMLALLRYLPTDPPTSILLATATRRSMGWLLEAAGISSTGLQGALRKRGLLGVWLWTVRAWQKDESADLAQTMAELDKALRRAEQIDAMIPCGRRRSDPLPLDPIDEGPSKFDPGPGVAPMPDPVPESMVPEAAPDLDDLPRTSPPPPPEPPASPSV